MSRKICVVTGSRADFGHLFGLCREIAGDPRLSLHLMVTGAHLTWQHGATWQEIEAEGFAIDARVDMSLSGDSPLAIAHSIGLAIPGMVEALQRIEPDILVILGDRYEMLAAAQAAMLLRVPVCHLHGGEASEGSMDEAIRHAITKMAHIHCVAAEPYARRIVQMGEDPARVFVTGAPGLDALSRVSFLSRAELEANLDVVLHPPVIVATYHPATLANDDTALLGALLAALADLPSATVVFTGVNADPGNAAVRDAIVTFAQARPERVRYVVSMGRRRYLSLMRLATAVVGNSSSGLIEAPALRVPSVNIGNRQRGRLMAASVISCGETKEDIAHGIQVALDPTFRAGLPANVSLYGQGDACMKIKDILARIELRDILMKRFHDLAPLPCHVDQRPV